jgi:hypothetical protein
MSKSNPRVTNPASKFLEFNGDTGKFLFYDKEAEKKVELPMPFYFVVLDELSAIKGYNERNSCGIYSNEIRNLKDDVLNVRSFKGGIQIVGKYNDIKDAALREGGKFCKSVYAMLITGKNQYELVNFQFHGSSFGAWLDKKFNVDQNAVCVESVAQGVKGKVTYVYPVFTKKNLNPDVDKAAIEMDKNLQIYFKSYFNQQIEKDVSEAVVVQDKEGEFYADNHWDELKEKRQAEKNETFNADSESDKLPWD